MRRFWLSLPLVAACASTPPASPPAAEPVVPVAASSAPPPAPPPALTVHDVTCGVRKPCKIVETQAAGTVSGKDLSVVKLARFETSVGEFSEREPGACDRFEHWLVVHEGGVVKQGTLLEVICNDGYGASGVGDDAIEVGPDSWRHAQNGGSAWRWDTTMELGLSPLRRRYEESASYWNVDLHFRRESFSWDAFQGRVAWFTPPCGKEDARPEGEAEIGGALEPPPRYARAWEVIPRVVLDPAFAKDGFRTTRLGRCSARLDAGGKRGFLLHGSTTSAADAEMRVVAASTGELFVEIRDDVPTGPTARWLVDDHLEVWTAAKEPPEFGGHCYEEGAEKPRQWVIRLADGKVFPGAGKPDPKAIGVAREVLEGGRLVRMKLTLPEASRALTLVFGDGDDGKRQKTRLATSKLLPADPASLGVVRAFAREDVTCAVEGGKLEPIVRAPYTPPSEGPKE